MCRVSEWPDSPVNGMCRWCLRTTANLRLTWHSYCYNAYQVATGLSPQQIQKTLCLVCGDPAGELGHKLSIVVASALGRGALLRAFTLPNLQWLCKPCHRRKTRLDRRIAKFVRVCGLGWRRALDLTTRHRK